MNMPDAPLQVFCSFAPEDADLYQQLHNHLRLLERQGRVTIWHARLITAGTNWAQVVDEQLARASIILLLISPAFLASDYCYGIEMQQAIGLEVFSVNYLDFTLVVLSTTFTKKLPPVQAYPVYHPRIKSRPCGCSASLRSLDAGWCTKPGPHRKGTRSRRCGKRLISNTWGNNSQLTKG